MLPEKINFRIKQLLRIKRRLYDTLVVRQSKADVIENYWDKQLALLAKRADQQKDPKVIELCQKLKDIPGEVKRHVLIQYISRCRVLYRIAFMQWRLKYPTEHTQTKRLEQMLANLLRDHTKKM